MPENFGARLRQRREERGIDLIAISEQTKIKLALLEALERDDVSHWPSGIFRRAYIRTYAQFIGLDPDVIVREFLEVHPDPGDTFAALAAADIPEDAARKNASPPTRLRNIVDSAIDSLARLRRPVATDVPSPAAVAAHLNGFATAVANLPAPPPSSPAEGLTSETDETPPQLGASFPPGSADTMAAIGPPSPSSQHELVGQPKASVAEMPVSEPTISPVPRADGPGRSAVRDEPVAEVKAGPSLRDIQASHESTLEGMAYLCTEFGRVATRDDVRRLMQHSARLLDATGLIVWLWDEMVEELRPALVHGYSDKVLAHLPAVSRDADNATAAAFRSANACEMAATAHRSGALVVPLLTSEGCSGVLAIELQQGIQPTRSVRAVATTLAAALTQLVQRSRTAELPAPAPVDPPVPAAKPAPALRPARIHR